MRPAWLSSILFAYPLCGESVFDALLAAKLTGEIDGDPLPCVVYWTAAAVATDVRAAKLLDSWGWLSPTSGDSPVVPS